MVAFKLSCNWVGVGYNDAPSTVAGWQVICIPWYTNIVNNIGCGWVAMDTTTASCVECKRSEYSTEYDTTLFGQRITKKAGHPNK